MALLDEVREFEHKVVGRLRELEPLLSEYEQLRALAQRLGISYSPQEQGAVAPARRARSVKKRSEPKSAAAPTRTRGAATAKTTAKRAGRPRSAGASPAAGATRASGETAPAAAKPAKPRATRAPKAASARPGQRSDDVLRVVGEQPGITVRELGERLGVDPTGLYRVVNKLSGDGRLRKDGPKLFAVEPSEPGSAGAESAAPPGGPTDAASGAA